MINKYKDNSKNAMKYNSGIAPVISLIIVLALIVVASVGSYFLLGKYQSKTYETSYLAPGTSEFVPAISDKDDIDVLESELEKTDVGSLDSDLNDLNSSASSL